MSDLDGIEEDTRRPVRKLGGRPHHEHREPDLVLTPHVIRPQRGDGRVQGRRQRCQHLSFAEKRLTVLESDK